jgi:hypothetical protein
MSATPRCRRSSFISPGCLRLPVGITHDEACAVIFKVPRRREAAGIVGHCVLRCGGH